MRSTVLCMSDKVLPAFVLLVVVDTVVGCTHGLIGTMSLETRVFGGGFLANATYKL